MLRLGWKSRVIQAQQSRPSAEQLVVLNMLMRFEKLPEDAGSMHKTVVSMMAAPSLRFVGTLIRQYKMTQAQIVEFATILKGQGTFKRTLTEPFHDLDSFLKSPGSLKNSLRTSIQSLVSWATVAAVNPVQAPPNYDSRLLHIALGGLGARSVLSLMLDEIKFQSSANTGVPSITTDVVTTLICIPTPGSRLGPTDWVHAGPSERNGCMSLREALRSEFDEATKTIRIDTRHAETVIRLYRRVEAQLTIPINDSMNDLAAQAIITDLGDMGVNEASAVTNVTVSGDQMDFTNTGATGTDLDMGMGINLNTSGDLDLLRGGNDDDIFAGLMGDNDMNFNDW
jgi:mediator of RNA polymerase II transcription subunit 5